jgi:flagellar hook protein FlgE
MDERTWWGGREFNVTILPIRGVAPSATLGDTESSISVYAGSPAQTEIAAGQFTFDFTEMGQRGQANTDIRALRWDGGGPGRLSDISIGQDGTIMGRYDNGRDRILGQIPLAFFSNPAGLDRVGGSFWRATANSGSFDGVGLIGQMIGGALEGSNVDLASEFTEMITTQRGFQAASRTITVSDEMLQELVNLKR